MVENENCYEMTARIEVDINCINSPMQKDEELFLNQEITKLIEDRGMKIKKINIMC